MIAHLSDFEQVLDTVWWIYTKSMNIKVCTIIVFYNILWISTKLIMVVIYSLNVSLNLLYYLQWLSAEPHRQVKHPLSASVAANYTSGCRVTQLSPATSKTQETAGSDKFETRCLLQSCQSCHAMRLSLCMGMWSMNWGNWIALARNLSLRPSVLWEF